MKAIALILSLLLSLFWGDGGDVRDSLDFGIQQTTVVSESTSAGRSADIPRNREICLMSAQGYAFAGNNSTHSVSARIPSPGRRVSPQNKFTFRIVKGGKIIDNNHLHPFLALAFVQLSGKKVAERYLFSICRLRL